MKGEVKAFLLSGVATDGMDVAGDLDADVTIETDVFRPIEIGGDLLPGRTLDIKGRLLDNGTTSDGRIQLSSGGLRGQILINTNNGGGSVWTGNVTVGSIIIGPGQQDPQNLSPHYARPSQPDLGGGAIGQAPYNIYEEDCDPPSQGHRLLNEFNTNSPVYVSFYGPLTAANPSLPVATIEFHRAYMPYTDGIDNWTDAALVFEIEIDESDPRKLRIVPVGSMPKSAGEYRLRTTSNLRCANVAGSPQVPVGEYWFWLGYDCNGNEEADAGDFLSAAGGCDKEEDCDCNRISDCCQIRVGGVPGDWETCEFADNRCTECDCDFNHSGQLNSQDFFDYVNCFFGSPCPTGEDADFNNDTFTNSQDFFDFLACFFDGCG